MEDKEKETGVIPLKAIKVKPQINERFLTASERFKVMNSLYSDTHQDCLVAMLDLFEYIITTQGLSPLWEARKFLTEKAERRAV